MPRVLLAGFALVLVGYMVGAARERARLVEYLRTAEGPSTVAGQAMLLAADRIEALS